MRPTIIILSLIGVAIATVTVQKGVMELIMAGSACISGGCVAIGAKNQAGWFPIILGVFQYIFAGSLQKKWLEITSSKRSHNSLLGYVPTEAQKSSYYASMKSIGVDKDQADKLINASTTGITQYVELGGISMTVNTNPDGSGTVHATSTKKRDGYAFGAYINERASITGISSSTVSQLASAAAAAFVNSYSSYYTVCTLIEENDTEGGYSYAAFTDWDENGSPPTSDGICESKFRKRDVTSIPMPT